ncbi:MAG: hypothetical protein WAV98_04165 [Minisyncoccia bacterium]
MEPQTPLICPSHTTQYIGTLIVGIALGAGASFVIGGGTYHAGFDAAKKRVLESPMGMIFNTPDDIRTISGTVTEVNGNRITIRTQSQNPFDDVTLADRIVSIEKDTKIIKISQGDTEAFQKEMEAFMKNAMSKKDAGAVPPQLPQPTSVNVDASSIKVGDTLVVAATENIKTMKKFTASEIQIH